MYNEFQYIERRKRNKRKYKGKRLLQYIFVNYIAPFIIMLLSAIIPITIAVIICIKDGYYNFNIIKFFVILTILLLITIPIGLIIVENITINFYETDWYI